MGPNAAPGRPPTVLWFTSLPSPYRLPVWEALGARVRLVVVLIGRQQANRARWAVPTARHFTFERLTPRGGSSSSDSGWSGFVSVVGLWRLVRRHRPAAVVVPAWGETAGLEVASLTALARLPRVGFYGSCAAGRHPSRALRAVKARVLRRFDAIVSYGTETTSLLTEDDGVDPGRIVTSFNTVDVAGFAAAAAAARRSEPTDGTHRYLFAGQLIERKAPDRVVEAFARLAGDGPAPTLTIVGTGPLRDHVAATARRLGVADRVRFTGFVGPDDMAEVYARHHTLVMPSLVEVWGLVANEALACGLHAVVSTTAGCSADLRGQRGVLVVDPDVDSLAAAMAESRRRWTGWIDQPEILTRGPERMADDVAEAVELAIARRAGTVSRRRAPDPAEGGR